MTLPSSFGKASHDAFLVFLCMALCLTAVRSSDEWISVKKVTPDPVFVTVGQTLKLRLDIEDLHVDRWNTTAFWVYTPDYSEYSPENELQWVRQLGSSSEHYYSYNKTRISRERQIDVVVNSMTLADSGVYRCKFRKPPHPWSIRVEFSVIVEGEEVSLHEVVPQIVYVTRGDTLKLEPNLPEAKASSSGKSYETFWDFSPPLESKQEEAVRIIGFTEKSMEDVDARASLEENGTTLVLKNTTLNDSGVYHLRMMEPKSTTAIHMDFNVVVEDKPVASMSCPSIVRLSEGGNFFCLCEDTSNSEVMAQASWLQNGVTFKHSRPFHEEELYLKNVTGRDAGFYTCRVRTVTAIVEVTLEVFVFPVEQEVKVDKPTMKHPTWYYLAGSLGVGLLLGIALVLAIKYVRGKCRKSQDVYEDVCTSPDLELDITAQYQDMNRNMSVYEEAGSTSPYEIADLTCPIYMDINQGSSPNQEINHEQCSHQNEATVVPGYTDLDHRVRVDSHPYQGLQQYRPPGNRV